MADNPETNNPEEAKPLNIFITGGDSGAGLLLAREAVKHGHSVYAAVTKGTEGARRIHQMGAVPVYPELTRESSLRSALMFAKADIVVNCAPQDFIGLPQLRMDYKEAAQQLEHGTEALVAAAGKLGVKRLIHLSPAFVYGNTSSAVKEDAHLEHGNVLIDAAIEAEEAILDGGIPGYVVRSGFIYGGWHDAMMGVSEMLRFGKGIAKGGGKASWIYEEDLAHALLKLVELSSDEGVAHVFNVSDGEPMAHTDFMSLLGKLYGIGEPSNVNPFLFPLQTNPIQLELLNNNTLIDSSKAMETLGWKPTTVSKEAGIEKSMVVWRALEAGDDDDEALSDAGESKALVTT